MSTLSNREGQDFIVLKLNEIAEWLYKNGTKKENLSFVFTASDASNQEEASTFCYVELADEQDANGLAEMTEASLAATVGQMNDIERISNEVEDELKDDETSNIEYWINKAKNN